MLDRGWLEPNKTISANRNSTRIIAKTHPLKDKKGVAFELPTKMFTNSDGKINTWD